MVERAERIIKAGLDAGFTYRFLAKGFFIDWIIKKNNQGTEYTKLAKMLKKAEKEMWTVLCRKHRSIILWRY